MQLSKFYMFSAAAFLMLLLATGCGRTDENRKEIKCWEDLSGKKIGVTVGSVQEKYISENCPDGCEVLRFNGFADEVEAMNSGKVDAILAADVHTVMLNIQDSSYRNALILDYTMDISMGFRKGDSLLIGDFNRFLAQYKESGEYEAMSRRWIVNFKKEGKMPQMNLPTEGEPLKVAVLLSILPYQHIDENGPAGLEIEVVERFCEWCGRPVEYMVMDFAAVIPALASGKVNMAAATITRTEERAQKIGFSDIMYSSYMSLIVKDTHEKRKSGFFTAVKNSIINNLIVEDRYKLILDGLMVTLAITLASLLFGTLFGAVICAMRMGRNLFLRKIAEVFVDVIRGIPILVILMVLFYIIFASSSISGETTAIVAFSLYFGAYVSEIYRSALISIDRGQFEAAYAMGFSKFRTYITIILPQMCRIVVPVFKGEATSLLKSTSVVGYVAIQDLTKMSDIIRSRTFDAFFPLITVAVIYFVLAWLMGKAIDLTIRR